MNIYMSEILSLVYMSCSDRAELNRFKFGDSKVNIKLNGFLLNVIIKCDLFGEQLLF